MYRALCLHTEECDQVSTKSMVHYRLKVTVAACILVPSAALMLSRPCSSLCALGAAGLQQVPPKGVDQAALPPGGLIKASGPSGTQCLH